MQAEVRQQTGATAPAAPLTPYQATPLTGLEALRLVWAGNPQSGDPAAWARLTDGLERLTVAQVQQRFAAEGIEVAADFITQIQVDAIRQRPGRELPVVALHNESAPALVDCHDAPVCHIAPPVKRAIVPQGYGATPALQLFKLTYSPAHTPTGVPLDRTASHQVLRERRTETIEALDCDGAIASFERSSCRMVTECKRVQAQGAAA
jgi:hypothetical protein